MVIMFLCRTKSNLKDVSSQQEQTLEVVGDDDTGGGNDTEIEFDEGTDTGDSQESLTSPPPAPSTTTSPLSDSTPRPNRKGRKRGSSLDVERSILEYLQQKKASTTVPTKEDDIGKFFESMAATVRKLPDRMQADVKFQIHQLVHQSEMQVLYPNPVYPAPPTTTPAMIRVPSMLDALHGNEMPYSVPTSTYSVL